MNISPAILFGALEISIFLLVVFVVLIVIIVKQRSKLKDNELEIFHLENSSDEPQNIPEQPINNTPETPEPELQQVAPPPPENPTYKEILKQELNRTKELYMGLTNNNKVKLDPNSDVSHQITALRYLFLNTENQSLIVKDNDKLFWQLIQKQLKKVINCYRLSVSNSKSIEFEEKIQLLESLIDDKSEEITTASNEIEELKNQLENLDSNDIDETENNEITDEAKEKLEQEIQEYKSNIENLKSQLEHLENMQSQVSQVHQTGENIHQQIIEIHCTGFFASVSIYMVNSVVFILSSHFVVRNYLFVLLIFMGRQHIVFGFRNTP